MSNVVVSIVNYKSADLTVACLESIIQYADLQSTRICVVDNHSQDGSFNKISESIVARRWSGWVRCIPAPKNGGFSYGNNICINHCQQQSEIEGQHDYVVLINPDAQVKPHAVQTLLDFMDQHPKIGIAGSRLTNGAGLIEGSAHIFPSPLGELEGSARLGVLSKYLSKYVVTPELQGQSHPCDWVSGAAMIIRYEVFKQIGLFDEAYFLYFEEVDFCRRARNAGWECWHVPDSVVMHLEGAATGIKNKAQRRPSYWYDSRRRYFIKHHGVLGLLLADLLWALGRSSYAIRRFTGLGAQGENTDPTWFAFDLLMGDFLALTGLGYLLNKQRPTK